MTFRNNIGPDAVAAATLAPSAFEPGLAPFKLLAPVAAPTVAHGPGETC